MYAEDDSSTRELIEICFQEYFFGKVNLEIFEDGSSLEERLQRGSEGIDLVLTDNKMPGFHGSEIIRDYAKKNGYEKIPFILCYGGSPEIGKQAIKDGATNYIIKPTNLNEFTNSIKRALKIE